MINSLDRIYALMLRHLRPTFRDPVRYMDMFYWPLLDIVLWGFSAAWLKKSDANSALATAMLLTSLVLWQVVFRSSIEITRNLLEEIWHQNLVNLFATPLSIYEWIAGIIGVSFIHSCWNIMFGSSMVYLIFGVNVFALGLNFLPLCLTMLLFGWTTGLLSSCLILVLGRRAEMLAWMFPWFFAAFVGVFYPVSVLPSWCQYFSWLLPATYAFENARNILATGLLRPDYLVIGIALGILSLSLAMGLFIKAFARTTNRGLVSLE